MRPFDNITLSQRVRDHLHGEILSNRLSPGTHLQEEVVAEQLGISRAPVREALRLLAAEDLVTIAPRRGAIVKSLSPLEFLAAYQVREALEMLAIRLAVPRFTSDDIQSLRALHRQMSALAERGDIEGFFQANATFHALIMERSGNDRLRATYRQLMNEMRRYRMRSLSLRGGIERSLTEHAAIIDAVERRDTQAAVGLLSEHIHVPERILLTSPEEQLVQAGGQW